MKKGLDFRYRGVSVVCRSARRRPAAHCERRALLPTSTGLNINLPLDTDPANHAFTVLDAATSSQISVVPANMPGQAMLSITGAVNTNNSHSEGTAFNHGAITITPLDANYASSDLASYQSLGDLLGMEYRQPCGAEALVSLAPGAVDWNAVAAQVTANFEATGS